MSWDTPFPPTLGSLQAPFPCENIDVESVTSQHVGSLRYANETMFEFFRHIRNAISHGNRFTFSRNEPSRPAAFKNKTIDHNLNGYENVLFTFIGIGDTLDLLDHLRDNI